MNRHTLHYFDLNPKPSTWALLRSGLSYCLTLCATAAVVYLLTVFALSL
jgi:hypothetical protein